jgi:MFS family permease
MPFFIHSFGGLAYPAAGLLAAATDFVIPASRQSLIVSILSAGTFFGALMTGDLADMIGRRSTIVMGCGVVIVGVMLQVASSGYGLLIASECNLHGFFETRLQVLVADTAYLLGWPSHGRFWSWLRVCTLDR